MIRIGSLCSGYGGLTLAVQSVLGGRVAWHSDIEPAADAVLSARFPGVPNIGDMTRVDWSKVEPVDILEGGTPCQDVSHAGRSAGMRAGTRSGLWSSMVDAIDVLRPRLVVWENVRGVLSAAADSDLEHCPVCVGDGSGDALRAGVFSGIWPSSGMTRAGVAYALPPWEPRTLGIGSSLLPTPRTSDTNGPGLHGDGGWIYGQRYRSCRPSAQRTARRAARTSGAHRGT